MCCTPQSQLTWGTSNADKQCVPVVAKRWKTTVGSVSENIGQRTNNQYVDALNVELK